MAKHNEKPYSRVNAAGKKPVARYTAHDGRRLSAGSFARKNHAQDAINAAHEQPAPPENRSTLGACSAAMALRAPGVRADDAVQPRADQRRLGRSSRAASC